MFWIIFKLNSKFSWDTYSLKPTPVGTMFLKLCSHRASILLRENIWNKHMFYARWLKWRQQGRALEMPELRGSWPIDWTNLLEWSLEGNHVMHREVGSQASPHSRCLSLRSRGKRRPVVSNEGWKPGSWSEEVDLVSPYILQWTDRPCSLFHWEGSPVSFFWNPQMMGLQGY